MLDYKISIDIFMEILVYPSIALSEPLLESVLPGEPISELLPELSTELTALSESILFKEMSDCSKFVDNWYCTQL